MYLFAAQSSNGQRFTLTVTAAELPKLVAATLAEDAAAIIAIKPA